MRKFRPGASFGDFVIRDSMTRRSRIGEEREWDFRRGWLVWIGVVLGLGVISVRLVTLQIVYGGRNRVLSDENRVKTIEIPAPRGIIYDRNGVAMANNRKETIVKDREIREKYTRLYPQGEIAAHVLGYLGEVAENEVGLLKEQGAKYSVGDWVGRSGIESVYEKQLRGVDGGRLVEVDNQGEVSRELGRKEPTKGTDVHLTLDVTLQEAASAAMGGKKGAAVVSVPGTGEILALVSSPSFDPNLFTGAQNPTEEEKMQRLLTDKNLPMFNRAIGGVYPPGSTFKMVTTTAAIDSGRVSSDFTFVDPGVITVNKYSYSNWLYSKGGATEGRVGFSRAITRSTDTFFYQVGDMTGPELIANWGKRMGLFDKTGVDLEGEAAGLMPSPDWKWAAKGERWFLGDTYIMAIGQGDVLTTPIQINLMTDILASGGKKCRMHLTSENSSCTRVEIGPETQAIIKKGMIGACSTGGTAFPLYDWNDAALASRSESVFARRQEGTLPVIACKTGTAEYVAQDGKVRTHGWLTAYAPANNPEIAVTVLMEGGGEGSNVAAPVVRKILSRFFEVTDTYPYGAIKHEVSE